jgi:phage terminase small subunit
MGRRGPKPQPTALKIARGNPHGHALPEEPQFDPPSVTAPPADLTGFARDEWVAQIDTLKARGVITENDLGQFRMYCVLAGKERDLANHLSSLKRWTSNRMKLERIYLQLAARSAAQAAHFGITPSSRSGVVAVKSTANVADAKRSRFFGARKEKGA